MPAVHSRAIVCNPAAVCLPRRQLCILRIQLRSVTNWKVCGCVFVSYSGPPAGAPAEKSATKLREEREQDICERQPDSRYTYVHLPSLVCLPACLPACLPTWHF
jgi:hypothetical protein